MRLGQQNLSPLRPTDNHSDAESTNEHNHPANGELSKPKLSHSRGVPHRDVKTPAPRIPGYLPLSLGDIFSRSFAGYFCKFSTLVSVAKSGWIAGSEGSPPGAIHFLLLALAAMELNLFVTVI